MPIIDLLCSKINIPILFHVTGMFSSIISNDWDALDLDTYKIPVTSWCVWFLRFTRIMKTQQLFFHFRYHVKNVIETSFDLLTRYAKS